MIRINKLEKKSLAPTFWNWAAETGRGKEEFIAKRPDGGKLKACNSWCPLCDVFQSAVNCEGRPLDSRSAENNLYWKWRDSLDDESRKKHAGMIAKKIERWEV